MWFDILYLMSRCLLVGIGEDFLKVKNGVFALTKDSMTIVIHQMTRREMADTFSTPMIQYFNSLEKAAYNAKRACLIWPVEYTRDHKR